MKLAVLLLLCSNVALATTDELTVAFGQSRPPYVDETSSDGISVRLFDAVAQQLGWHYRAIFASNHRMEKLLEDGQVNISVEVQPTNANLYYSQPFISYSNYAVYRDDKELTLAHMDELQPYSICAWQNAHNHLGIQHWATKKADYHEYPEQKWQVTDWLNKRCQLLLIDDTLLQYHLKLFSHHKTTQQIEIGAYKKVLLPIKTNPLWFYVGFTDAAMRDAFDVQLSELKQSGQYELIRSSF